MPMMRQASGYTAWEGGSNMGATSFYDPYRDGVTVTLLKTWMDCRERARYVLTGWTPRRQGAALIQGTIGHRVLQLLYEAVQKGQTKGKLPGMARQLRSIETAVAEWKKENRTAADREVGDADTAGDLLQAIVPMYVRHWAKDFTKVSWMSLEQQFQFPLDVPGLPGPSRPIPIKGKMDGVFKDGKRARLFETKFKSHIDETVLADVMPYETQVSTYLVALRRMHRLTPAGIRYNVIRRPQLRPKKGETGSAFQTRVAEDIVTRPTWYFVRLDMDVDPADVDRYEDRLTDVVKDFVLWWQGEVAHYRNDNQCENKYGACPFLPACSRRDFSMMFKRKTVFRELDSTI